MKQDSTVAEPEFDRVAEDYAKHIGPMIRLTGENREYYARERIAWLSAELKRIGFRPRTIMDFGCGTGISAPFLIDMLKPDSYVGVDVSQKSLEVARKGCRYLEGPQFMALDEFRPAAQIDLVFTNGVFHHIPPTSRSDSISYIFRSLRQGGIVSYYEYNPLNLILLLGMKLSPVDRNAVPLMPHASRKLLRSHGFEFTMDSYLFFFPRALKCLRRYESILSRLPLGAQHVVLARKPGER